MAKNKKMKKVAIKDPPPLKEAAPKLERQVEEPVELGAFHTVLYVAKVIIAVGCFLTVITGFMAEEGINISTFDQIINAIYFALLMGSVALHKKKTGVYLLFAYFVLELLVQYGLGYVAYTQGLFGANMKTTLINYSWGSLAILVVLFLYYRKRMHLLD